MCTDHLVGLQEEHEEVEQVIKHPECAGLGALISEEGVTLDWRHSAVTQLIAALANWTRRIHQNNIKFHLC